MAVPESSSAKKEKGFALFCFPNPHLRPMLIYLIGFMGCGKSTHGKALAKHLGFDFIDMDEALQQSVSKPMADLFNEPDGEAAFRKSESEWIDKNSMLLTNTVIATGGGAPCFSDNLQVMNKTGITVYLQLHPGSLFHRLASVKEKRPLIAKLTDTELMDFIHTKLLEREHFYRQAHLIIKGESLNVKSLADEIKSHPLFTDKK